RPSDMIHPQNMKKFISSHERMHLRKVDSFFILKIVKTNGGENIKDVLITDRLTKKFNDFIAVDNMSLTVKQGEIFRFLGANGASKSTAIHMVTGLLQKTDGEITIFGKDHKKNRTDIKKEIGLVPQEIAIYEDLTAYENVEFFAGL